MPSKNEKLKYKIICNAEIIKHNDVDTLMIRKFLQKKEEIKTVVDEIIKTGTFRFEGELIFRDTKKAIDKLHDSGLY